MFVNKPSREVTGLLVCLHQYPPASTHLPVPTCHCGVSKVRLVPVHVPAWLQEPGSEASGPALLNSGADTATTPCVGDACAPSPSQDAGSDYDAEDESVSSPLSGDAPTAVADSDAADDADDGTIAPVIAAPTAAEPVVEAGGLATDSTDGGTDTAMAPCEGDECSDLPPVGTPGADAGAGVDVTGGPADADADADDGGEATLGPVTPTSGVADERGLASGVLAASAAVAAFLAM